MVRRSEALTPDTFNTASFGNSNGATPWDPDWTEANTDSGGVTAGQIRIDDSNNNTLRFVGGATSDGAQITRAMDLSAATSATISFTFNADGLDGTYNTTTQTGTGEYIQVLFAANGTTFVAIDGFTSKAELQTAPTISPVRSRPMRRSGSSARQSAPQTRAWRSMTSRSPGSWPLKRSTAAMATTPTRSHSATATTSSTKPGMRVC